MIRRFALISLALLLLIAAGGAIWLWRNRPVLYSNPAVPRANPAYDRLFQPPSRLPAGPSNILAGLDPRTPSRSIIRIPYDPLPADVGYLPYELLIAESNRVKLAEGNLQLEQISVAYATTLTNFFSRRIRLPAQNFSAEGKKLSDETARTIWNFEELLSFRGTFPSARFYFTGSNLPPIKTLGFNIFDKRTKRTLVNFNSLSSAHIPATTNASRTHLNYDCDLRLWHQSPIELILTLGLGPEENLEMNPQLGAELRFAAGMVKLLWMTNGSAGATGTEFSNSTNYLTMEIMPPNPDAPVHSTVAFLSWPQATEAPIEFELLGDDDRKLTIDRQSRSDQLHWVSGPFAVDEIRRIRLKYHARVYRLVFNLPEMPGLPLANRNVKNLFDIRLPSISFHYGHEMRSDLGQLIAMDFPSEPMSFTNGLFPLVRTNTTPREIFKEWVSYRLNKEDDLLVDGKTSTIIVKKSPLRQLLDRIKKMIPGI